MGSGAGGGRCKVARMKPRLGEGGPHGSLRGTGEKSQGLLGRTANFAERHGCLSPSLLPGPLSNPSPASARPRLSEACGTMPRPLLGGWFWGASGRLFKSSSLARISKGFIPSKARLYFGEGAGVEECPPNQRPPRAGCAKNITKT